MSRIGIVDDEAFEIKLLRLTFETAGHEVVAFQNPLKLIPYLRDHKIDGLVLDIMMPEITGWEMLARLRGEACAKSLPILVLTSLDEAPYRVRALRTGANDYVSKPFDPAELLARMEGLIKYHSKDIAELQGILQVNPIHQILQYLAQEPRRGRLEIFTGLERGFFYISDQGGISAEFRKFKGAEAAECMLELRNGTFRFHTVEDPETEEEQLKNLDNLLLKTAWIADELETRDKFLPKSGESLKVTGAIPELPFKFDFLPVGQVMDLIENSPGINLDQILAQSITAPNRVFLTVALLVQGEAVSAR